MISLKRYLDGEPPAVAEPALQDEGLLEPLVRAYGAALEGMGDSSVDACPGVGDSLKQRMAELCADLSPSMDVAALHATDRNVQQELRDWGRTASRHLHARTAEVKHLLLVMSSAGEAVATRDQRCAGQMNEVTARLQRIATLEDLSQIRTSIETSAADLKTSIERMTAEGQTAVDQLKKQVAVYRARLEQAEELASRDPLTGLRNRLCLESLIESRIASRQTFCVAMIDLDGFKKVNDTYGHLAGDELLRQFAAELRSVCRSTDLIGRWGGDEFLLALDCDRKEAETRIKRLHNWACGEYVVRGKQGMQRLRLDASIGLVQHQPPETLPALLTRADTAMYECKEAARRSRAG